MKRILFASLLAAGLPVMASNTYMEAPAGAPEVVVPDSTGFKFTDVKINKTTPVKDQNKSGTCWSFSGMGLIYSDLSQEVSC